MRLFKARMSAMVDCGISEDCSLVTLTIHDGWKSRTHAFAVEDAVQLFLHLQDALRHAEKKSALTLEVLGRFHQARGWPGR